MCEHNNNNNSFSYVNLVMNKGEPGESALYISTRERESSSATLKPQKQQTHFFVLFFVLFFFLLLRAAIIGFNFRSPLKLVSRDSIKSLLPIYYPIVNCSLQCWFCIVVLVVMYIIFLIGFQFWTNCAENEIVSFVQSRGRDGELLI